MAKLQEFAKGKDVGRMGWIFGLGYDDALLGRHPNRDDLDKVSTEIPVIAVHISGHFSAVNSAALAKIGYTAATKDPEGGVIRRRPGTREPLGVNEELASFRRKLAREEDDKTVYVVPFSRRLPRDIEASLAEGRLRWPQIETLLPRRFGAKTITPCLWFDGQAEAAAELYTAVFPNSRITAVSRYGEAGREIHGGQPGTVLTMKKIDMAALERAYAG